ncbi:hypothetical protein [uncultured Sutterella sp.]|uniref:hypothetical protein n=1 Tax=uncultured Sutterella sp. TaxID=286133 RepID=UPI0035A59BCE
MAVFLVFAGRLAVRIPIRAQEIAAEVAVPANAVARPEFRRTGLVGLETDFIFILAANPGQIGIGFDAGLLDVPARSKLNTKRL